MRTNRNRIVFAGDLVYRYPVQEADRMAVEEHAGNQRRARAAGLPVPAVLDVIDGPEPCIVMQRAAGTPLMETPLDDASLIRLGTDLSEFLEALWAVRQWVPAQVPWPELWRALDDAAQCSQTSAAAQVAVDAPVRPSHGDLSPGNLMVDRRGRLTAVLDWDAAAMSDPATDFSALCANIPEVAAAALRQCTPASGAMDRRAQIYLDTWNLQNTLWQSDRHPWLSGHRPVSRPRL